MSCTLTLFGRPLADMAEKDANYFRGHLAELDDCEDCVNYTEAWALWHQWKEQQCKLLVFDTVGPTT